VIASLAKAFADAKLHARDEFPKESCGLIVGNSYIRCENIRLPIEMHEEGNAECGCQLCSFEIDPAVFARHEDVQMVIHSHPNGPFYPSKADMEGQLLADVPYGIIALDAERISEEMVMWGDALPIAPVVGRTFMHGVHDCFSLIRDTFRLGKDALLEQGIKDWPYEPITFPISPREDGWWNGEADLYDANWAKHGFVQIDSTEAKPGDVFLMKIKSDKHNHGGVLIGESLIMHHLPLRLSRREPAGIWGRQATRWIRYKGPVDA
jgi:proteasome lid subunit RPN8/RPN11